MPSGLAAARRPSTRRCALRREHGEDALVLAGGTFVGILLSTGLLPPPPAFLALRDVAGPARRRRGRTACWCSARWRPTGRWRPTREVARRLAGARGLPAARRQRARAQPGHDRRRAGRRRLRLRPAGAAGGARGRGRAGRARRAAARCRCRELIVDHYTTLLEPDELLVEVRLPPSAAPSRLPQVPLAPRRGPPLRGRRARRRPRPATARLQRRAGRGRRRQRTAGGAARGLRAGRGPGDEPRAGRGDRPALRRGASTRSTTPAGRPPTAAASSPSRCAGRWPGRGVNERVTGAIRYAIDVERPGMLHARLVRAPLAPARVTRVDGRRRAGRRRGACCRRTWPAWRRYGCIIRDQDVLPQGLVRHVGEPVAAVGLRRRARGPGGGGADRGGVRRPAGRLRARGGARRGRAAGARPHRPGARRATCGRTPAPTPATASACCTAAARPASRRPTSWWRASGAAPAPSTRRWSRTPAPPSGRTAG